MTKREMLITAGILLGIFMASMEATVVATAMPTIVSQLGSLESYSWVFSGYLLTSTTTIPIYGKLADLYGRRRVYAAAMFIFLAGSLLCAFAQTMPQLIVFRMLQGAGAGGLLPVAFIIIGDLFDYKRRARLQGLFAGVWGVSSVMGPLLGGFLVDRVSWPWVFLINIVPGLAAGAIVWLAMPGPVRPRATNVAIDFTGAALLTTGAVALLLGMLDLQHPAGWALVALSVVLLSALLWVERRAADPIIPLGLFRERVFAVGCLHGVLVGWIMFGAIAFVPLFVQAVMGVSATAAGSTLTPFMLSWVTASTIGGRLVLRMRYRSLMLIGMALLTVGAFILARVNAATTQAAIMLAMALMGVGMGFSIPIFLIVVQSSVAKRWMGVATSTLQFSRNIGGAIGVNAMGVVLSLWLAGGLAAVGLNPEAISLNSLIDPLTETVNTAAIDDSIRVVLADALRGVFLISFIAALLALAATALAPNQDIAQAARREPAESQAIGQQPQSPTTRGP